MRKLFIDDIRNPEDRGFASDMPVVRNSADANLLIAENGCPKFISFDHDLGGNDTAMEVVNFLINCDLTWVNFIPQDFQFNVHSDNPVGKANIEGKLGGYLRFREEQGDSYE